MSKPTPALIAALVMSDRTPLSRHAAVRSQQRSIPQHVIELLIDYGQEQSAGGGCHRYAFTTRTWQAFSKTAGSVAKKIERFRSAYVVLGADDQVVTVGWVH